MKAQLLMTTLFLSPFYLKRSSASITQSFFLHNLHRDAYSTALSTIIWLQANILYNSDMSRTMTPTGEAMLG